MSNKAFYQTFFQTEQLFRRADDVSTFPALVLAASDSPTVTPADADTLPELAVNVPTAAIIEQPIPPTVRRPATPLLSQKVLIMVDEDLLPSDLLFLEKILKAVHLDVAGVDLLNVHGTKNINFAELLAGKYIHHFFTFGVPFSRLNLDIMMDLYHPVRFEGITFLMADPLPAIEADVALKKKLWDSLKKVFLWR